MPTRLVISLVVLAIALLTYAPVGGSSMAMDMSAAAAMGDCPLPEDDCSTNGKDGAEKTCAIDGRCLLGCAFAAGFPNFHAATASFPFGLPFGSPAAHPDQARPASASGFPPFRPPQHSSLA